MEILEPEEGLWSGPSSKTGTGGYERPEIPARALQVGRCGVRGHALFARIDESGVRGATEGWIKKSDSDEFREQREFRSSQWPETYARQASTLSLSLSLILTLSLLPSETGRSSRALPTFAYLRTHVAFCA